MKAWQVTRHGEPEDVLEFTEVTRPEPGQGQILVRVLAAAANFPDVLLCRGTYQVKVPLPFTLGVEMCGEVVETGQGVRDIQPGDRVIGGHRAPVARRRPRRPAPPRRRPDNGPHRLHPLTAKLHLVRCPGHTARARPGLVTSR